MAAMSATVMSTARTKKRGINRLMDLLAGKAVSVGVEMDGGCPSPRGVRVGTEVLVAVPRGRGVSEGVESSRGGEAMVELASGVEVGVAVAVEDGGWVTVGAGPNSCNVTSSM
jgi:hypothetical protein